MTTGQSALVSGTCEQFEPELLGVSGPQRMIAADQLAAAFDPAAGNEIVEADNAAADPVAGFEHGHVIACRQQLVGGGEPGQSPHR